MLETLELALTESHCLYTTTTSSMLEGYTHTRSLIQFVASLLEALIAQTPDSLDFDLESVPSVQRCALADAISNPIPT